MEYRYCKIYSKNHDLGVVLQTDHQIDYVAPKMTSNWQRFFDEEVRGEDVSNFHPPKFSPVFLRHLKHIVEAWQDSVFVSDIHILNSTDSFDLVLDDLAQKPHI